MVYEEVLIWDKDHKPAVANTKILLWRQYLDESIDGAVSIPDLVEENDDFCRKQYLEFIYGLGNTKFNCKTLVSHFTYEKGFSYWWLNLLVEKCNYEKSPQIENAIKLFAFEKWAFSHSLQKIKLVSSNDALAECFKKWCKKFEIEFTWQKSKPDTTNTPVDKKIFYALPLFLQAPIWLLKFVYEYRPLFGVGVDEWRKATASVTFVSYLTNLSSTDLAVGIYQSSYWGSLPEKIQGSGVNGRWLHLYQKNSLFPNAASAARSLSALNDASSGSQRYAALESFFTFKLMMFVLVEWLTIAVKSVYIKFNLMRVFTDRSELWPLVEGDWKQSLFGVPSIKNVLYRRLLESAFDRYDKKQRCVFLQENQAWEFALVQIWKRLQLGRIIGMPHSTVRYWDLRYFCDPRNYQAREPNPMPRPNYIAINGKAARRAYLKGGYPIDELVDVEALRFMDLTNIFQRRGNRAASPDRPRRLLVLTDYLEKHNRAQMKLLKEAKNLYDCDMKISVKFHPATPIENIDYPDIEFQLVEGPLLDALLKCDMVYTSSNTSAAVDAYVIGLPVITILDPTLLNLSPLRDCDDVFFVRNCHELGNALREGISGQTNKKSRNNYFTLDLRFIRWNKLLGITNP